MNPFSDLVRNLGPVRIAALGGTAIAVLGFFIFLATRLSTGSMPSFTAISEIADSGSIVQQLESQNIPYEIRAGGTQVYVPSDQVLRLRVSLAGQGLPGGGSMGYEVFDQSQALGTTNFVQNVNLVRALEGELSRTIASIRTSGARVHLVLPQRELFSRDRRKPSASVVLQVQGSGRLGKEQVSSIQHLVAAAVPELGPESVSVLDDRGQLLARGFGEEGSAQLAAENADEMRIAHEDRIRRQIEELIERTVGRGRVRAEVTADLDFARVTENAERYDPDSAVARSTQNLAEEERNTDQNRVSTVSVENNLPESRVGADGGETSSSERNRTEETVNFEISRTVTNTIRETGTLRRLSVAVLVDYGFTEDEDGNRTYSPRPPEEIEQIESLVRSAVGYDANRGDSIEVVNMRFAPLERVDLDDGSLLFGISKEEFLQLAEVLVLGVVGLLVILLVVRPVLTRLFESMPTTLARRCRWRLDQQEGGSPNWPGGCDGRYGRSARREDEEESLLDQMIDINQVAGVCGHPRSRRSVRSSTSIRKRRSRSSATGCTRKWHQRELTGLHAAG